jgi:hypothetical protein
MLVCIGPLVHDVGRPIRTFVTPAATVHIQRVVFYVEVIDVGYHLLNTLYSRIAEFEKLIAVDTNQMIMLPIAEGALVLRLIFAELMADDEIALDKKLQCIVYGSSAYAMS